MQIMQLQLHSDVDSRPSEPFERSYRGLPATAGMPAIACEDNADFMKALDSAGLKMNLIVTSPPYNLGQGLRNQDHVRQLSGNATECHRTVCPVATSTRVAVLAGWKLRGRWRGGSAGRLVVSPVQRARIAAPQSHNLALWSWIARVQTAVRSLRNNKLVDERRRLYVES